MKAYKIGDRPIPDWVKSLVDAGNVIFRTDGWCEVGNKFTRYSAPTGFYVVLTDDGRCMTSPPERIEKEVNEI